MTKGNQQDMNTYNHQTYNSGMNHGYMAEYKCFTTQTHTQSFVSQILSKHINYKLEQVHRVRYTYMVMDKPQIHSKNNSTSENTQYVIQYL